MRNNKILLQFLPGLQKLFCIVPVGLLTDFWMAPDTTRTFPPTTTLLYLLKLLLGLLCDENSWRDEAVFCSVVIGLLSALRFFAATLATLAQDRKSRSPSFSAVSKDATCNKISLRYRTYLSFFYVLTCITLISSIYPLPAMLSLLVTSDAINI